MSVDGLRVALFSGNYNYVRDGANQALNRLVGYLMRQGMGVRTYSPVVDQPAFAPTGPLVGVPAVPIPGRSEYRMPVALAFAARRDLGRFAPHIVHVSSPDLLGHRAVTWARQRGIPVLASVHTRFETYPRYYGMQMLEPLMLRGLRRFYNRCDALVAPSPSMVSLLQEQGMNEDVSLWTRGVDHTIFNADRRDLAWRRSMGIADNERVVGFLGRLVMEKGLDVFAASVAQLLERGVAHRVMVIGEGPGRDWFAAHVPEAIFTGHQTGAELGRAVASMDVFFNPSVTETFGNVTLEAMACAVPVVAAAATGSSNLVKHQVTGMLVAPQNCAGFVEALSGYLLDPALARRHGTAGERLASDYDWDSVNSAVTGAYARLLRERQD
ncbi:glycosyltransferase family 1 protein [Croceicoccus sp. F390]|uniref:Glycosyltransferase family 1 protein n=1 Tax=Croceicoccus esteveae TaxID=3075597 RepID=A0ABU2ZF92_9SPHN|nr:glycosyltransferase family 1 protein [Croceicoccus sp. F390]MDT0574969.1 glycosyltransferase family 1 protein [Croceicoccus sp. F390]